MWRVSVYLTIICSLFLFFVFVCCCFLAFGNCRDVTLGENDFLMVCTFKVSNIFEAFCQVRIIQILHTRYTDFELELHACACSIIPRAINNAAEYIVILFKISPFNFFLNRYLSFSNLKTSSESLSQMG